MRKRLMRMESELLDACLGQEVTIYYIGESSGVAGSDSGVITECDGMFLRLERRGDTDLLVPLVAIRIIKTKMRGGHAETRTLPRAVGTLPANGDKEPAG